MLVLCPVPSLVWEIIKELVGGEERFDQLSGSWSDSFTVNLGTEAFEKTKALDNWRVDSNFFVGPCRREFADWNLKPRLVHYLVLEQTPLVIPVFSDIEPRGGGTFIALEGIDVVLKSRRSCHPLPSYSPRGQEVHRVFGITSDATPSCSARLQRTTFVSPVLICLLFVQRAL